MMYHGIVLARDMLFGTSGVFYTAGHEGMYRTDVLRGRLADSEKHVILDAVWLDEPVDYAGAWKLAQNMLNGTPEEEAGSIPVMRTESMN
jgi:hypothetical protein